MAKYVSCTKDLPNGVTAGKRYEIMNQTGRAFEITDDDGDIRFCLKECCAHLRDGAKWVFHDEAEEVPAMNYKVGDKARVIGNTVSHDFPIGEVVKFAGGGANDRWEYLDGHDFWFINPDNFKGNLELLGEPAADLTLTLDIPTEAMKEFADHCERAASALERIKAALA